MVKNFKKTCSTEAGMTSAYSFCSRENMNILDNANALSFFYVVIINIVFLFNVLSLNIINFIRLFIGLLSVLEKKNNGVELINVA